MWFLRSKVVDAERAGYDAEQVQAEEALGYYRLVSLQGLFIEANEKVLAPLADPIEDFPDEVDGRDFEVVADEADEAA